MHWSYLIIYYNIIIIDVCPWHLWRLFGGVLGQPLCTVRYFLVLFKKQDLFLRSCSSWDWFLGPCSCVVFSVLCILCCVFCSVHLVSRFSCLFKIKKVIPLVEYQCNTAHANIGEKNPTEKMWKKVGIFLSPEECTRKEMTGGPKVQTYIFNPPTPLVCDQT